MIPIEQQQRLHINIYGAVQGVGFRPFIYRLARELELRGWVNNSAQGVTIEVEGERSQLDIFLTRIEQEKPPRSLIERLESLFLAPVGYGSFEIRASITGEKSALILPDIATCRDCLQEIFTSNNRRYRYPFTNCTHCGPRFSIIEALPYDRPNTTMKAFILCSDCQAEYTNPLNRRFHAQPNACPHCGPYLELWNPEGQILASSEEALQLTAEAIRQGKIVAIKGLGGFHLLVDARKETAIKRLRRAKQRQEKPFALLYPSLELVKAHCQVSDLEEELLRSPQAPIVLLQRKLEVLRDALSLMPHASVAPHNPSLGIMLPSNPLYHLLLADLGFPLVATSGNLANEPLCIDENEARQRLGKIAAVFLIHNRRIVHPVDDSIVGVFGEQPVVLRRGRGYAPLPISLPQGIKNQLGAIRNYPPLLSPISPISSPLKLKILAVGAHFKNTVALLIEEQILISQHLGDLETVLAFENFQKAIALFSAFYEFQPTAIACDLNPDYLSTQFAYHLGKQLQIPVIPVQHHYAHILSCMAENQLEGSVLGIAWDGTGYGLDGTIWGGEFLAITPTSCQRIAHLRPFPLPGGEKAIKEPRRAALGLLYELFGTPLFTLPSLAPVEAFSPSELGILQRMLTNKLNTPLTSSAGRLFDAIASILDLQQQNQFEGQAAMALEFRLDLEMFKSDESYGFELLQFGNRESSSILDWTIMVSEILADKEAGLAISKISAKFHNTLVEMMITVAKQVGKPQVVLTGGCFQNHYLTLKASQRLREEGFSPYWHQRIPPNDGGIALGQIMAALREFTGGKEQCV